MKEILYTNTRDEQEKVTASQAILNGLAKDGGLYVPTEIPELDIDLDVLAKMTYQETAYEVMRRFLTDFTEEELKNCIKNEWSPAKFWQMGVPKNCAVTIVEVEGGIPKIIEEDKLYY